MKTTFFSATILTLLLFSLGKVQSQKSFYFVPDSALERSELMTEWMTDELILDADQQRVLKQMNEKYAERLQPILMSDASPSWKLANVRELFADRIEETKGVLNADQVKIIEERWQLWTVILKSSLAVLKDRK